MNENVRTVTFTIIVLYVFVLIVRCNVVYEKLLCGTDVRTHTRRPRTFVLRIKYHDNIIITFTSSPIYSHRCCRSRHAMLFYGTDIVGVTHRVVVLFENDYFDIII